VALSIIEYDRIDLDSTTCDLSCCRSIQGLPVSGSQLISITLGRNTFDRLVRICTASRVAFLPVLVETFFAPHMVVSAYSVAEFNLALKNGSSASFADIALPHGIVRAAVKNCATLLSGARLHRLI
jgi:hypothetical protein